MRKAFSRVVRTGLCAVAAAWLSAEEMPVRIYTSADGLARDDVLRIRRDSRGYLWFGTAEGLSIFDGYQFTNYTVADGLPNRAVSDVLETRSGEFWIATYAGLCRFEPKPSSGKHFVPYRLSQGVFANQIHQLIERRDGSIWFGTEGGLWRLTRNGAGPSAERVRLPSREEDALRVFSLVEDRHGTLWAASSDGLYTIETNGRTTCTGRAERLPDDYVHDVIEDTQGRMWAATTRAICQIAPGFPAGGHIVSRIVRLSEESGQATALFRSTEGKLWMAGSGLFQFQPDAPANEPVFRRVAAPLRGTLLGPIGEDADRNLWVGGPGAMKVTRHGFMTFSSSDGLRSLRIHALTQDRNGRLHVITYPEAGNHGRVTIHRFNGDKFVATDSYLPAGFQYAWGDSQSIFEDHAGEWWVPTQNGLLRFAAPARVADLADSRPKKIYTQLDGLPNDIVLRLFEDSRGDVWIGVHRGLARWNRNTGHIQRYGGADGLPLVTEKPAALGTPQFITEDRRGDIWIGFHPNGLARYHAGKFQFYGDADGLPKGQINWVYSDHLGRLWIASSQGGAARLDDLAAPRPKFHTYTTAQGLSSNQVYTVVEDRDGRIYLGGGRGVDQLNPDGGNVRHFTPADGLPPARVQYALRDRTGALWFASGLGLTRYVPQPDSAAAPPIPLIRRLRVAGSTVPVSELGENAIPGVRLGPAQNNLRIEFGSVNFRSGEVLRYQYRLLGADPEWTPPTNERTVNYSGLPPGSYNFAVRAVNGDGLVSERSATIGFVIVPPLWRRPWVVVLEAALFAVGLYAAHRYRLKHLLAVERIRTRLASDLHDDIGSGLAEIAILSEVVVAEPHSAGDLAVRVGERARELRAGMSDIVWSVDSRPRTLADLIGRVGQSVYSMLESNGRSVQFEAPEASIASSIVLPPDRARQVLLICREALNNIARHACASEVSVRMELQSRMLLIYIQDNGRGFDPEFCHTGMGLRNLRRRAEEARAELAIHSTLGQGSHLTLRLPLR